MSPLARSLLALACAALLHASSADVTQRIRAEFPNWDENWPCGYHEMGIVKDKYIQEIELPTQMVPHNFINITNAAKPDQALVGQLMIVCDLRGKAECLSLKPVAANKHSPIRYTCHPFGACPDGVVVFANQYVIKKLL